MIGLRSLHASSMRSSPAACYVHAIYGPPLSMRVNLINGGLTVQPVDHVYDFDDHSLTAAVTIELSSTS